MCGQAVRRCCLGCRARAASAQCPESVAKPGVRNAPLEMGEQDTVYVSNLAKDVTEEDLAERFGSIGILKLDKKTREKKIFIYKDKVTGEPKGDAVVTYEDPAAASAAVNWFNGSELKGQKIAVELARKKDPPPMAFGGRGGGRGGYGGGGGHGGGGDGGDFGGHRGGGRGMHLLCSALHGGSLSQAEVAEALVEAARVTGCAAPAATPTLLVASHGMGLAHHLSISAAPSC